MMTGKIKKNNAKNRADVTSALLISHKLSSVFKKAIPAPRIS